MDITLNKAMQVAVNIAQQSIKLSQSHRKFKEEVLDNHRKQQDDANIRILEENLQTTDLNDQEIWMHNVVGLLGSLYDCLAFPPEGIQIRSVIELLTDVRSFLKFRSNHPAQSV